MLRRIRSGDLIYFVTVTAEFPFLAVQRLADQCGGVWAAYGAVARNTVSAEQRLRDVLQKIDPMNRLLTADASLVLSGSFARYEMVEGSDFDWSLLIDGVVTNEHAELSRAIYSAMDDPGFPKPGASETFGKMVFSHDLVHCIGGGADSNANLTRRMLMLLESRPLSLSAADSSTPVWENVVGNILQRYFEEDIHFTPERGRVPRFMLNDLTRYWRTICVDYAAKHREQSGKKWALRNAKLRFSRKLLYASGLAFCLSCQLKPPAPAQTTLFDSTFEPGADLFIQKAKAFAHTPALEYLAAFVDAFVREPKKRTEVSRLIFGTYDWWLETISQRDSRRILESLSPSEAGGNLLFQTVRTKSADFAKGLELLFFNRTHADEPDEIAALTCQYIGF